MIEAFKKCHEENPVTKFFGVCNDHKSAMDICFRAEKEMKRKKNFDEAKRKRDRAKAKYGIDDF